MHFEKAFCLSKCIKLYFFHNFFLGFTSKFRKGWVTLNTGCFFFWGGGGGGLIALQGLVLGGLRDG